MTKPTQAQLSQFLSQVDVDAPFLDKIKIAYRPYICPFDDLLMYVEDDDVVYDIGCGSGQFLLLVSAFTKAAKLYGIEIAERLIHNANQLFAKHRVQQPFGFATFDGVHLPANIAEADKVFLIDVIHHVPPKMQYDFLKKIYGLMKPGAILVLKDIDASSPLVYGNKLHDLILSKEIGNELKLSEAKEYATTFGFKILEEKSKRMYWYAHYTLLLQKP